MEPVGTRSRRDSTFAESFLAIVEHVACSVVGHLMALDVVPVAPDLADDQVATKLSQLLGTRARVNTEVQLV